MPNIGEIIAMPLPAAPLPEYGKWQWQLGTGTGVQLLEGAYDIDVTSVTSDDDVSKSTITFLTNGMDVLVIYGGLSNDYPDPARPGREGHKAILNAFELKSISAP